MSAVSQMLSAEVIDEPRQHGQPDVFIARPAAEVKWERRPLTLTRRPLCDVLARLLVERLLAADTAEVEGVAVVGRDVSRIGCADCHPTDRVSRLQGRGFAHLATGFGLSGIAFRAYYLHDLRQDAQGDLLRRNGPDIKPRGVLNPLQILWGNAVFAEVLEDGLPSFRTGDEGDIASLESLAAVVGEAFARRSSGDLAPAPLATAR